MKCVNCGNELAENEEFCAKCGNNAQQQVVEAPKIDGNLNLTTIFAMVGFAFSFSNVIAGLVLSILALKRYKNQQSKQYKPLAVAGLVISIISLITVVLCVVSTSLIFFIEMLLSIILSATAGGGMYY